MPLLLLLLAAVILFGPALWVKMVVKAHNKDRADFPGTAAEFARHILDELNLQDVKVEMTDMGDHYSPDERAVRLSRAHYDARSVSGVAIAAHEVGHAIQHRDEYKPFMRRLGVARTERVLVLFSQVLAFMPMSMALFSGAPQIAFFSFLVLFITAMTSFVLRLTNLKVEYDASFARAMPILENGYLPPQDLPAARRILKVAALTYLSSALLLVFRLLLFRR